MIEYKYKRIQGVWKFTENGHTMFETDVLRRLQRLAYLEEQIKQGKLLPMHVVSNCPDCLYKDLDREDSYCKNCGEYYN